ncbi:hypothetical protein C0585_03640 [Candidatus Woesearchaeota archaeon]|nr:MAG: hypothetical protein C0585_03640 [Candidatus Woesearchaeota archaeon]
MERGSSSVNYNPSANFNPRSVSNEPPFSNVISKKPILLIVLLLILITFSVFQTYKVYEKKSQISDLESQISQLDYQLSESRSTESELKRSLDERYDELEEVKSNYEEILSNYTQLNDDFSDLSKDYVDFDKEINEYIIKVENYQKDIEESISWFRENEKLGNSSIEKLLSYDLKDECLKIDGSVCEINLGCFQLINKKEYNMSYKFNESDQKSETYILSLVDFLDAQGGDCEDYSVFFKAEMNTLLGECDYKQVTPYAWFRNDSDKYFLDEKESIYLPNASKIEFPDYKYPTVVCGNFFDENLDAIVGHCLVALSIEEISLEEDLRYLGGSILIEPQNGEYRGILNSESSGIYLLDENSNDVESYVYAVITGNDYYIYKVEENVWNSYQEMDEGLDVLRDLMIDSYETH